MECNAWSQSYLHLLSRLTKAENSTSIQSKSFQRANFNGIVFNPTQAKRQSTSRTQIFLRQTYHNHRSSLYLIRCSSKLLRPCQIELLPPPQVNRVTTTQPLRNMSCFDVKAYRNYFTTMKLDSQNKNTCPVPVLLTWNPDKFRSCLHKSKHSLDILLMIERHIRV